VFLIHTTLIKINVSLTTNKYKKNIVLARRYVFKHYNKKILGKIIISLQYHYIATYVVALFLINEERFENFHLKSSK